MLEAFGASGYVPKFYGRVSPDIFAMEFLEGEHPSGRSHGKQSDSFAQAESFLKLFHQQGYAHNDFRRNNILIQQDGSVYFFDFAAAIRKPQSCRWLLFPWCWLLSIMQRADSASLLKIKPDFTGKPLTALERSKLENPK